MKRVTRLTAHLDHHDFVPDPSAVSDLIVAGYSDRSANRRQLQILDGGGKVLRFFATGHHRVFHPYWSPGGCRIVYAARVSESDRADLFVIDLPSGGWSREARLQCPDVSARPPS